MRSPPARRAHERPDGALARERIADELLKLLAGGDPAPTLALMLGHGILAPVLPEIGLDGVERLALVVAREAACDVVPSALRRLGALLPRSAEVASSVAERLRLSRAAQKRLASAAAPAEARADRPSQLAYRIGADAALDWLLLNAPEGADALAGWERPRLPMTGGALIALGLAPGPGVAATLQALEREWVEAGFPSREWVEARAAALVGQRPRDIQ